MYLLYLQPSLYLGFAGKFFVEKILDHRGDDKNERQYLIKWDEKRLSWHRKSEHTLL